MSADLIVFSHLRWDFVHQRPQHLLGHLARERRVFYFEEPMATAGGPPFLDVSHPLENVAVCRPHLTGAEPGFAPSSHEALRALLDGLLEDFSIQEWMAWFYTPMALPLVAGRDPLGLVYDCMDELSAFKGAPPRLPELEAALLDRADLVLTGGRSLYRAKKDRNPNVHCFPSSVDREHFRPRDDRRDPSEQASIARPRLGFFGVIDERLDVELLAAVADDRPEWQIVMVGPVVKIDPDTLPLRPNIHWLGMQPYDRLPDFVAGWDVCLLPFALNASTRFISPTKTLEYLAAERPVVSTPIVDVASDFGEVVGVAATPEEFVLLCEEALHRPGEERAGEILQMRRILNGTSWESTAEGVEALLQEVERGDEGPQGDGPRGGGPRGLVRRGGRRERTALPQDGGGPPPVVIIGAGPTGLSAAFHLGRGSVLLEREDRVGGFCRSIEDGGFTFDQAGHIMFSKEPYVHELYDLLLGDNVHWQDREAWVYTNGVHTRYPFQGALYGLPADIIRDCLLGAFDAREGSLRENGGEPGNFEEFIHRVWGAGIARHFALPYNRKLWTVPLDEMETSWLGGRVPMPDMGEMIRGALEASPPPMGPNARFGYPLKGGFQALMDGFLPHLEGEVRTNCGVESVDPDRRVLTLEGGETLPYEQLVSTMRLPALVEMMGDAAPARVRRAAARLRSVAVRCVNLGVGRPDITDKHWTYYAGSTVFHRIFFQGNASPHCSPPGGFGLTCEISYSDTKPLPVEGEALVRMCIEDCVRVGVLREDDPILVAHQVDMPCAYILYDHRRKESVRLIREWLAGKGIHLAGRYSEWEYYNSDHAFLAGRRAAEAVRSPEMHRIHEATRTGALSAAEDGSPTRRRTASGS